MRIEHGDCLDVMARLIEEGVVVDSIVTDPPYHLTSIVKRFGDTSPSDDTKTSERSRQRSDGYARLATGFMGKKWDGGDIAFRPEVWKLAIQILKPGGHMLVFGGTRTYHRMACAVEDAGFEIRDQVGWLFGSGFPKSHNVAVGIAKKFNPSWETGDPLPPVAEPWNGWGTTLKPAWEPIVLARKPLSEKTIAANVLEHGTGALNVDGCRVGTNESLDGGAYAKEGSDRETYEEWRFKRKGGAGEFKQPKGRWPANVIHDGSPEVMEAFARFGESKSTGGAGKKSHGGFGKRVYGRYALDRSGQNAGGLGDTGTAARFFYTAKADKKDRLQSKHPTVKPVDLIAYLCRLITPPKGLILDPFAGSGTTGMACMREGFDCILIEKEDEYIADIRHRLKHVKGEDAPLFAEVG